MSCVDHERQAKTSRCAHKGRIPYLNFDLVYYADDTILFSTDNRALNELLKLIETVRGKYGLRLNRNKRAVIQKNNDGLVHCANDEPLRKKMGATYLGSEINNEADIKHELLSKMQEVRKTWLKGYECEH